MTLNKKKVKVISAPDANVQPVWGGTSHVAGDNPYTGASVFFSGNSHEQKGKSGQKGIGVVIDNNLVEVEGNEMGFKSNDGDFVIMGNLKNPLTGNKFKKDAKEIADLEAQAGKKMLGADKVLDRNKAAVSRFQKIGKDTGNIIKEGADIRQKSAAGLKEGYAKIQQAMLDYMSNGLPVYKNGGKTSNKDYVRRTIVDAANEYGISPEDLLALAGRESSFLYNAKGWPTKSGTAVGHFQFMPETAKEYGIEGKLGSSKPEDIKEVSRAGAKHFKKLLDQFGGDKILAFGAYNAGAGAFTNENGILDAAAKWKGVDRGAITGEDVIQYWEHQRATNPSKNKNLYRNQTYNHIMNILGRQPGVASGDGGQTQYMTVAPNVPVANIPEPTITPNLNYASGLPEVPKEMGKKFKVVKTPIGLLPEEMVKNPWKYVKDGVSAFNEANTKAPGGKPKNKYKNKLGVMDMLPAVMAAFDTPDHVPHNQFNPEYLTPYRVSFQDNLNENTAAFNAARDMLPGNAAAQSVLAAQLYNANNSVLGQQFRANQALEGEITNKNTELSNQAQMQNLQLSIAQQDKQAAAKANTEARKEQAMAWMSDAFAKNKQHNVMMNMYNGMTDFSTDNNGNIDYNGLPIVDQLSWGRGFVPYGKKESDDDKKKKKARYRQNLT